MELTGLLNNPKSYKNTTYDYRRKQKTSLKKLSLVKRTGRSELFQKLNIRHRNNKFLYYLTNSTRLLIPSLFYQVRLNAKLSQLKNLDVAYINYRLEYYNSLNNKTQLNSNSITLSDFKLTKKHKTYFFDTYLYTRYFDKNLQIHHTFGDITDIPATPSIVKSRPIHGDNKNSVLLKLNKIRHFQFVVDKIPFSEKKDLLVGRFNGEQENRLRFIRKFYLHPMCDVGQIYKNGCQRRYIKNYLSISKQLQYKFILCLEGNDVSSALKWVMSSNSIAVMPKPKYETWFMEGTLIPDYHYIEINDDYSNLEEKLLYYISNSHKSKEIIENANNFVAQFKNKKQEDIISLLVLKKYFTKTQQIRQI